MKNNWECFCDESYYGLWAVRSGNEKRWGHCFHLQTRDEAEGLCALMNSVGAVPVLKTPVGDFTLTTEDELSSSETYVMACRWRDGGSVAKWLVVREVNVTERIDRLAREQREALGTKEAKE